MIQADAGRAGTFLLGGETKINRLGFGAMRVTGHGVWGEHENPQRCMDTLRHLHDAGVNFIDTADSYGPVVSEKMIGETLYPYASDMVIATKAGQLRLGPNQWVPLGRPDYLRQQALMSLRWLKVDCIDLWQLHRIDPKVPRDEQFDAIKSLQDDGIIRHAGLSEVGIEEIEQAQTYFKVATVQNRYSLDERKHEDVLEYCQQHAIGFIPWSPLSSGKLAKADSALQEIAKRHHASTAQIALAWLLQRSPNMLPIPGTSQSTHLLENIAAVDIHFDASELASLQAMA